MNEGEEKETEGVDEQTIDSGGFTVDEDMKVCERRYG